MVKPGERFHAVYYTAVFENDLIKNRGELELSCVLLAINNQEITNGKLGRGGLLSSVPFPDLQH